MMKEINDEIVLEREEEISTFLTEFSENKDPRSRRGRYFSIGELFLVVLCAQICSFESLREYETYGKLNLIFLVILFAEGQ